MGEYRQIPLATNETPSRSGVVSLESLTNWYPVPTAGPGKSQISLQPAPALKAWSTVGDGPIRGMLEFNGSVFVVSGEQLYVVDWQKTATLVGPVLGNGPVRMAHNGVRVAIAAKKHFYAAKHDEILDLPEQYMTGVTYQDGYLIGTKGQSEKFFVSAIDDATSWGALDFSSADAGADLLVTCLQDHRELALFGEKTTEFWYNAGEASFPFVRAQGGYIEHGCSAAGSVAKYENALFWLDDKKQVRRAVGYQSQKISTTEIEQEIAAATGPSSAEAFIYTQAGHDHYVLNFADLTVVFDLKTNRWHKRASEGLSRWRVNTFAEVNNIPLVGDYSTNEIYELDLDTFADRSAADTITRTAILPPLHGQGRRMFLDELYIDLEAGVGLDGVTQGDDPELLLEYSEDGGKSWIGRVPAKMGKIGEYGNRCTWTRLGSFYQRTLRLSVTDPVRAVIVGAYARIEAGQ